MGKVRGRPMNKEIQGERVILREQREEDAVFFLVLVQSAPDHVSVRFYRFHR